MRPTRWRRSTHVIIGVAVLLMVAAVVAAAALLRGGPSAGEAGVAPVPTPATADPGVRPVAAEAAEPTPAGLTAALAPVLDNPDLGILTGRVADAQTGTQLWARDPGMPMTPASTNKVLTTAAALLTLDRDATVETTVLAADQDVWPGLVVLRGGGDPTLSAAPPGRETWYRDAARISDLAQQVRRSGINVRAVQVDVSQYSGPTMATGWNPRSVEGGDIAPIEPVMLDGGRTQPVSVDSVRSPTPALDAGRALATALDVDPATVTVAAPSAHRTAEQIAVVHSLPLIERLRVMMYASDNVMAETIGREVAAAVGRPQSFAGAVDAVLSTLRKAGIDTTGARLFDNSGLSVDDRLSAQTIDEVLVAAVGDDHPKLRPLVDLLPVAGGSGTLSYRYHDTAATGWLRAKTGSLTGVNALAGIVTDADGRVLTFTLISNDAGPTGRNAIDAVAAALRSCGCRR